jgi:hypothetical protein
MLTSVIIYQLITRIHMYTKISVTPLHEHDYSSGHRVGVEMGKKNLIPNKS